MAVLLFTRKKNFINGKQTDLTDMFKRASKSVYGMVSPDHVSHSSKFFSYDDSRKQKRTMMTLNSQMKEIIQM